jgi:hypothetical protein
MDSGDPDSRNYVNNSLCDDLCKILDLRNPCNMHLDK